MSTILRVISGVLRTLRVPAALGLLAMGFLGMLMSFHLVRPSDESELYWAVALTAAVNAESLFVVCCLLAHRGGGRFPRWPFGLALFIHLGLAVYAALVAWVLALIGKDTGHGTIFAVFLLFDAPINIFAVMMMPD